MSRAPKPVTRKIWTIRLRERMGKPRALDLFCKAGGVTKGLQRAGFHVTGVDIEPQPRYCGDSFLQADAIGVLEFLLNNRECQFVGGSQDHYPEICDACGSPWSAKDHQVPIDFIWASPPCQGYSDLRKLSGKEYPRLIEPVRNLLNQIGKPFIIENVDTAPLLNPQMLCGTMFDLKVFRHRIFESGYFRWEAPAHVTHNGRTGTHRYPYKPDNGYVQVTGGGNCTVKQASEAMGIDWMVKKDLNESIPPAYSEFIGRQAMLQLGSRGA